MPVSFPEDSLQFDFTSLNFPFDFSFFLRALPFNSTKYHHGQRHPAKQKRTGQNRNRTARSDQREENISNIYTQSKSSIQLNSIILTNKSLQIRFASPLLRLDIGFPRSNPVQPSIDVRIVFLQIRSLGRFEAFDWENHENYLRYGQDWSGDESAR